MADDEEEPETVYFVKKMREAVSSLSPRATEVVNEYSVKLADMTHQSSATFVGILIQMHARVWCDFCEAIGTAIAKDLAKAGAVTDFRCPQCKGPLSGGASCPRCQTRPH